MTLRPDERVWVTGDVHLSPEDSERSSFFLEFLAEARREADRLVLLGDIFDYWIGPAFAETCCYRPVLEAFREASRAGFPVDFIAGNRDFMGPGELRAYGLNVFRDLVSYERGGRRTLVTHGDLLVSGDWTYRRFRLWARSWPLRLGYWLVPNRVRLAMALYMRGRSKKRLATVKQMDYPVDTTLLGRWLRTHRASELLMGHLHREEVHELGDGQLGRVLPGWSSRSAPHFVLDDPSRLASYPTAVAS